jgi:putative NADH-flavin reductase
VETRGAQPGRGARPVSGGRTDVDWTYVSSGAILAPGERTGRYRTAGDQLLAGDNGRSEISMEDFAVALLNEIEQGRHVGQRFTAAR